MASHPLRSAVEAVLATKGETLVDFLTERLSAGKAPKAIVPELLEATGIEVGFRTLYRWIDDLDIRKAS